MNRWSREKFLEYCAKRLVGNSEELWERVSERLGSDHPLLTRAVLVERLIDLAGDASVDDLIQKLGSEPSDYFSEFVFKLLEREATQKWIDRRQSSDSAKQLLSVEEHLQLLKLLAQEMWLNKSSLLRKDFVDLVADLFLEECEKSPDIAIQVKEKLVNHSMLKVGVDRNSVQFDHEDFQEYFLGQVLADVLCQNNKGSIDNFLRMNNLPTSAVDSAASRCCSLLDDLRPIFATLLLLGAGAPDTSFVKENAARILLRLAELMGGKLKMSDLRFPQDSLRGRKLSDISFERCVFSPTALRPEDLQRVQFEDCIFERIQLRDSSKFADVEFENSSVDCIQLDDENSSYSPQRNHEILENRGAVVSHRFQMELEPQEVDENADLLLHAMRVFLRSTHVNENVFKQKFGVRASAFFDDVLPVLLENDILTEVQYRGAGVQRRYKLNVSMSKVESALQSHHYTLSEIVEFLSHS